VQLESYSLIAVAEKRWVNHTTAALQSMTVNCFRRGRQERWWGDVALYVRKWIDCTELSLKSSDEQVESLWVKIWSQANKGNLMAGGYYRQPNQGEPVDESFCFHLQEVSHSQIRSCWRTSFTLTSAGKAAQQALDGPGDSRSALRVTS